MKADFFICPRVCILPVDPMLEICCLKAQLSCWSHLYTAEFATNKLVWFVQMSALKSANKDLKGMMKTVKIQDIDVCLLIVVISLSNLVHFILVSF